METKSFKPGLIQKTINVETNDPNKKFITLTLKINLVSFIEANPEYANIFTFKGEEGRIAISIKSQKYYDFKIKEVILDNKKLKYSLDSPTDENAKKEKGYTLTLIAPPDLEPNIYNGKIIIKTDVKEQPNVEISYNINVRNLITVSPDPININVSSRIYKVIALEDIPIYEKNSCDSSIIGTLKQNQETFISSQEGDFAQIRFEGNKNGFIHLEKVKKIYGGSSAYVSVQKHKGEDLEIKKVECDLSFIKVEYKLVQPNYYSITLTYEGDINKNNYTGNLIIYTNDKEQSIIKKPIMVNVGAEAMTPQKGPRTIPLEKKLEMKKPPQRLEESK